MADVVKNYDPEVVNELSLRIAVLREQCSDLKDHMNNGEPWAVHRLGGPRVQITPEVRPREFQAALSEMEEAVRSLELAEHALLIYAFKEAP